MNTFYLGTHMPSWLAHEQLPRHVNLFVSHRRLADRKTLPAARGHWALDSGGFTELQMYGNWGRVPAPDYVAAVLRYDDEIGNLGWAAPQDWMCEPVIIEGGRVGPITFAGTGLSVAEHQRRTVANFVELERLWYAQTDRESPFMPVLQGWTLADYLTCWQSYGEAGINLGEYPVVGVGSVCRRQATDEIGDILAAIRDLDPGVPLHGFGVKRQGLARYGRYLDSADSLAWSFDARRSAPLDGCEGHINCANCLTYALRWEADTRAAANEEDPDA